MKVFLKIQLHRTISELKKIIVTGNSSSKYVETKPSESLHLNLPLIELPQNITVIPHQLLSDQGLVSMTQAIRNVSGLAKTYGELNDYSLIIRGTDASYNVFRNGVGGYWWNQQEDIAMLEKIEFVKGPAGFIVSLSQPGGNVNNVTKQPTKEPIVSVDAAFGSFNLMRLTADLGGSLTKSGKLYYRFNTGVHKQERAFQFGKAIRYFICPAISYEFNKKTSLTAEYNFMYGKTSGNNDDLPALNGKMFALPRNFAVADAASDAITGIDNYYRLLIKHDFNDNWHLNAQFASVYGPWDHQALDANYQIPVSHDTLYRYSGFTHYINYANPAHAYLDGKFQTGKMFEHKVLLGIDYQNGGSKGKTGNNLGEKKFGLYLPSPDYYVNPDSLKNFKFDPYGQAVFHWITLYIQDHIKIARKLVITLAGHLTHASIRFKVDGELPEEQKNTVFNPRAGLTWLIGDNTSVYALYDQCFLEQPGMDFDHKLFKPLTGYDIETGMKSYLFNKKLALDFSIFNIVKNHLLTQDLLHPGFYIQKAQVISKGLDFDMTGNITPALLVNANYEYVDAKVTKDNDPNVIGTKNPLTPDHRANLWSQYRLAHGKLKGLAFAMGYQYTGIRSASSDKTKFLPAYNLFDAALSYSTEKFNISFNIYNITNNNYATVGYYDQAVGWRYTPGEPVNIMLSYGVKLVSQKK